MRILLLSRWLPYPADNGSKIRIWNLLRYLGQEHQVALLTFAESVTEIDPNALRVLRDSCAEVRVLPYREFQPRRAKAVAAVFSTQPRSLVDTFSSEMMDAVYGQVEQHPPDLIVASQLDMVPYVLRVRRVPALLEELEVSVLKEQSANVGSLPQRYRSRLMWLKLRYYLRRVLPRFAACTVASRRELEQVQAAVPRYRNVQVIPNAVDVPSYAGDWGAPVPNSLVFSGALTYNANYDAVRYFLSDIYPRIVRAVPDVQLTITGRTAGVDLTALEPQPRVRYTGHVPDIRPVVATSWASVVPLRLGGGTRFKILEAMALGTPVIATSKGAEGLDVVHGEHLLIADTPEIFAKQAIEVLRSPRLRAQLVAHGRQIVAARYDAAAVGRQLCDLVETILDESRVAPPGVRRPA